MKKEKRGQVTIFIIIAIIIVAIALLIYSFYPEIKASLGLEAQTPSGFIQSCLEEQIKTDVEKLSAQGGSLAPEHYIMYNNEKIEYLCYINEYYKTCIVQQPMLKEHIESEIKNEIRGEVTACFNSLKENYEKRGYDVNMKEGGTTVELLPKRIASTFNYSLTLAKGGDTAQYNSFSVVLNNNLYELISIANSILNWEVSYGDAETTTYMNYYHDLKVEKRKQSDGTKIYILTDRNTENKFQFASRSFAWPPGFGV
ncbi:hypothetical protein A3K74_02770 [Candidatus Pacearchaeota archaeon RBG_13_33_26]|nr:MAG: hypothetical protein A3K74_02770 [Candidatus Pacearchaeota archaeon RBG_13_33_26]